MYTPYYTDTMTYTMFIIRHINFYIYIFISDQHSGLPSQDVARSWPKRKLQRWTCPTSPGPGKPVLLKHQR